MHPILEIAIGVALGMTVFLVIIWILGMCVYICCGKDKNVASVRKLKTYPGSNKVMEVPKPDMVVEGQDTVIEPSLTDEVKIENQV